MSFRPGTPLLLSVAVSEIRPPSMTVAPSRMLSLVSIERLRMVGEVVTPVVVGSALLTSWLTSRSMRSPA